MAEILQRSLLPSLPAVDGMSLAAQYVPDRVDRLVLGLDAVPMATLLYAQLRRRPGGRSLRWATAGHPPPVVRHHDGTVEVLTAATGLLLGVTDDVLRESRQLDLEVGSILLAFTDGVVERRGEDVSAGMDRVAAVLADADPTDLDALIAAVIATARTDGDDDRPPSPCASTPEMHPVDRRSRPPVPAAGPGKAGRNAGWRPTVGPT